MAARLTDVQYTLLKQIAEQNGFLHYTLEEYAVGEKGDNYLGQMLCVKIKNNTKNLEVIVKLAPKNDEFRESLQVRELFKKEMYIYDTVLTTFTSFQNEYNMKNPFNAYAKFYGKCDDEYNECLVLENLVKNGYSLWNRKLPMNPDHVALVMKEYGKFHAVSHAMKHKNVTLFRKIVNVIDKDLTEHEERNLRMFLKNSCATLKKAAEGNGVLEKAYKRLVSDLDGYFLGEILKPREKMVVNHADCWCNNMLFKYDVSIFFLFIYKE